MGKTLCQDHFLIDFLTYLRSRYSKILDNLLGSFKNNQPSKVSKPVALEYMTGSEDFGNLFVLFLARFIKLVSNEFNRCSISSNDFD